MTHNQLLIKLFETPSGDDDYEMIDNIMLYISERCANGKLNQIDLLFDMISTDCIPTQYLVALLRGSFMINQQLFSWKDLRDRAFQSSYRRGEDAIDIFGGLEDEYADSYEPNVIVQHLFGLTIRNN